MSESVVGTVAASERAPRFPSQLNSDANPAAKNQWKQQVAERLAAHRSRKGKRSGAQAALALDVVDRPISPADSRAARVAAAVAARYAQAPTYRDLLEAQAEAALRQAEAAAAAAQAAAVSAEAAAVARQVLLAGFDGFEKRSEGAGIEKAAACEAKLAKQLNEAREGRSAIRIEANDVALAQLAISEAEVDEWLAEHEEVYSGPVAVPVPLPTNLIAFPRQLVAPRKARPRLAEGPLREESDAAPENAQLRIFEVEAAIIATRAPDAGLPATVEWSSIRLDAAAPAFLPVFESEQVAPQFHRASHVGQPLCTAALRKRVLAGAVDASLVCLGFAAFAAAFAATTTHLPPRLPAAMASAAVLAGIALIYLVLFFSLAEATPGMRCARIALCTFDDENPTRAAMRRRIAAMLLSACPLGLGYVWAWLDHDRLGWHDRLTRMYQRSY